jgi:glucokinase
MGGRYAIGVDIGGTKIAAGLIDLTRGSALARRRVLTERSDGGERALGGAVELARALHEEAAQKDIAVAAVGIGVPELVDRQGIVRSSYNFSWAGMSLREEFSARSPDLPPVVVESDVRAAARAEALYGAARGFEFCAYVSVGTGISYCLCIDGEPYLGARGYAIHFASSPLSVRCPQCGARHAPLVEEIASGPGLARAYARACGRSVSGTEAVLTAAAEGDPNAIAVVDDAGRLLSAAIGCVVNMLDPEAVVIGGGLGTAEGPYFPAIERETRAHIFAEDCRGLPILRATLGSDAGIIGAAACAIRSPDGAERNPGSA